MNNLLRILILLIPITIFGTPQEPETLIFGIDTIFIDYYPLEELRKIDNELDQKLEKLSPWVMSSNWRGYNGTWKIKNDSLFLVKIEAFDGVEIKKTNLNILFSNEQINSNGVFAYWYSNDLQATYGELLDFDNYSWTYIHSGKFNCKIRNGIVSDIEIELKSQTEINQIIKSKKIREDTMLYHVVEKNPVLLTEERNYSLKEIEDYINKQISYPKSSENCSGIVIISFVVEKDGNISRKRIRKKLCFEHDNEAIRIMELMKKWEPGMVKGEVVRTLINTPIKFEYN